MNSTTLTFRGRDARVDNVVIVLQTIINLRISARCALLGTDICRDRRNTLTRRYHVQDQAKEACGESSGSRDSSSPDSGRDLAESDGEGRHVQRHRVEVVQ